MRLARLGAAVALVLVSCKSAPRKGWRRPLSPEDAAALVARCLPGAEPTNERVAEVELEWLRRDPKPPSYPADAPAFRLDATFRWTDTTRTTLESISVGTLGFTLDHTRENAARYRAAIECIFSHEAVPGHVSRKLLSMLDAGELGDMGQPGYDGFHFSTFFRTQRDGFYGSTIMSY